MKNTTSGDEDDGNGGSNSAAKYRGTSIVFSFTPGRDWKNYVERLEMFFEVNSVPTDKRVPSILTLMGSKMNALWRSISAPRKPKDLSFTEIVDTLAQHVDPKPIIIAERYKFQTMFKKWKEPFPNVSDVERLTVLLKSVFTATHDVTDSRKRFILL